MQNNFEKVDVGSIMDRRRSGFPVLSGFIAGKPVQDLMFITSASGPMFITSASILHLTKPTKEIGLP